MKCKDCQFENIDWMAAYDGRGLIEFSYCGKDITRGRLVDPDVERECDDGVEKVEVEKVESLEVGHAT